MLGKADTSSIYYPSLNETVLEKHKDQMKDFSIGREKFKMLCLTHPELAKFGINIDSSRSRYHLLVIDICDIALMNEEVATHILENPKLQNNNRLQSGFSSLICEYFPNLIVKLFTIQPSIGTVKLPTAEEIIKAITSNPLLFTELCTYQKFKNLINKAEVLINLSLINEEIALFILNNCKEFSKFDKYWYTTTAGLKFENVALELIKDQFYMEELGNEDLLNEKQLAVLESKAINKVSTLWLANKDSGSTFFCLPQELIQEIAKTYARIGNFHSFFPSARNEQIEDRTTADIRHDGTVFK